MDFKPKPGSFRPYLEYMQRSKEATSPLSLLEILSRQVQPALPMLDLQTLAGMDAQPYRSALISLRDAGYIAIEGEPLNEVVKLTESGAKVASLARPA